LLRKQQKTLGATFFLPHPVDSTPSSCLFEHWIELLAITVLGVQSSEHAVRGMRIGQIATRFSHHFVQL